MSTIGERIVEAEAKGVTEKELNILFQAYLIEQKYGLIPNREKVVKDYRPYGICLHDTAVFGTREEAETVYSQMVAITTRYGVLKVEDYYDLCGLTDVDWLKHIGFGWSEKAVSDMSIVRAHHGYMIDIPMAERLDAERRRRW